MHSFRRNQLTILIASSLMMTFKLCLTLNGFGSVPPTGKPFRSFPSPSFEVAGSPLLFRGPLQPLKKRLNRPEMVSKSSSPETDLLAITTDGNFVAVARYSSRESVGVSLLVATSSFSLAAVLVLLVLMGVSDLSPLVWC